jgi:Protein of unknown function with HXXEE motif
LEVILAPSRSAARPWDRGILRGRCQRRTWRSSVDLPTVDATARQKRLPGDAANDDGRPRPVWGLGLPAWVPIPDDVGEDGLTQQHVNLAISLMGAYIAGASVVGVRSRGRSRRFRGVLLAFGLHGFGHIGVSAALRQYTAGVATSPTIVIPYWLWARRALAREGLSDRDGTAPWAAASLLLIPVVHVMTRLVLRRLKR